jgi:hypothetical protein
MANGLEQVLMVLSTTAERWERLAESLPVDLLQRSPAAGEWSAVECLQHLVNTERRVSPPSPRGTIRRALSSSRGSQRAGEPNSNIPGVNRLSAHKVKTWPWVISMLRSSRFSRPRANSSPWPLSSAACPVTMGWPNQVHCTAR